MLLAVFSSGAWLVFHTLSVSLPNPKSPLRIYSNQLRDDLKWILISAFKRAKHSIYLQIYALTDPDLKELLKQKSQEGVAVTIFYDQKASPHLQEELFPYGIHAYPVKSSGLMHRKIFVVDRETVYLGSVNLTTQSLKMHDNLMIGIYSEKLAQFCLSSDRCMETFKIGSLELTLFLLPDAKKEAFSALLSALQQAKRSIHAALFTFTHPTLIETLIDLKQRGIELNIAIDYYSKRGASQQCALSLEKNGIPILESLGQQLLHHKWALIDQRTLVMGSANWTEAAFRENQDFVMLLSPLQDEQKRSIKKIWQAIYSESL